MAIIKCVECGKEISDMEKACPECGCPVSESLKAAPMLQEDGAEEFGNGNESGEVFNEIKMEVPMENTNPKPVKKSKMKFIIAAIAGILVISAAIGGIVVHNRNEAEKARVLAEKKAREKKIKAYNDYVDNLLLLNTTIQGGGVKAGDVSELTYSVWLDKIYDRYETDTYEYTSGASDFNEAIQNLHNDSEIIEKLGKVESVQGEAKAILKLLENPPNGLENVYVEALDFYKKYDALAEYALSPSGNISQYGSGLLTVMREYTDCIDKFTAVIPEKKEMNEED